MQNLLSFQKETFELIKHKFELIQNLENISIFEKIIF
jgi:hypothetical protein